MYIPKTSLWNSPTTINLIPVHVGLSYITDGGQNFGLAKTTTFEKKTFSTNYDKKPCH